MYTAGTALVDALGEAGVSYVFANFGSDHPAILEAMAEAQAKGRKVPKVVTSPSEFVGMCAADGHARVSGQAQAVVVHVECGTQSLAGAIHNAAKARVPVFVFAGSSPFTQEGELRGSRNEFIQWIQDVFDQRGIVRGYMKYDNELRTGANLKQMVHRAMQFAHSSPRGPVYLMAAREVMEEEVAPVAIDLAQWHPIEPPALPPAAVATIAADLASAKAPLIVTSYLGRNADAPAVLQRVCEAYGIGVLESVPSAMNFAPDHPLHQGVQWNQKTQNDSLAAADLVLVLDSDIPWIGAHNRPAAAARVHHIDLDVLKEQMPLFYIPAICRAKADCAVALIQLDAALKQNPPSADLIAARKAHWGRLRESVVARRENEARAAQGQVTSISLMAALRGLIDDDTIIVNEGVTNYQPVFDHLGMRRPGSIFTSGAGSLGWFGGACIGVKLAAPDKTVIAVAGDGSYMFSQPSSVFWMARHYQTPFLQIVLNNRGWNAPRFSMLSLHPDGYGAKANDIGVAFDPPPDYGAIAAAAGNAAAFAIKQASEIEAVLREALRVVRAERRCAVVDAWLDR
jgi:acetolactate synthase I/II/III large subunit